MSEDLWEQNHMGIWPKANPGYKISFRDLRFQGWELVASLNSNDWFDAKHREEFIKRTTFILGQEPLIKGNDNIDLS